MRLALHHSTRSGQNYSYLNRPFLPGPTTWPYWHLLRSSNQRHPTAGNICLHAEKEEKEHVLTPFIDRSGIKIALGQREKTQRKQMDAVKWTTGTTKKKKKNGARRQNIGSPDRNIKTPVTKSVRIRFLVSAPRPHRPNLHEKFATRNASKQEK